MDDIGTRQLNLPCGPITVRCHDGILHGRGIKYAEAGRFEKPAPTQWTTSLDCTGPAVIAPQLPFSIASVIGNINAGRVQGEDCQHVTVAAPADAKNLPVMVYFHGGAYLSGGGDLDAYNPCGLARENIVAVNVTYRVGHFGYLPIPGIAPANLGLLDQIAALKWVQGNISSFGGDPTRVTIYGQSAGGDSVYCLLLCEEAKGLFHRCIIQSACMGRFDEPEELRGQMTAAMGEHMLQILNSSKHSLSTEEFLAVLPELMATAQSVHFSLLPMAPILGEEPLPPRSEVKQRLQEAAKRIPIFIGYTTDEGSAFAYVDKDHSSAWYSDEVFKNGSDRLIQDVSDTVGKCPRYEFVWHPKDSKWGAAHCIELPFLLGGVDGWRSAPFLYGEEEAIIERLGPEMKKLWTAFARGDDLGGRKFVIDEDFVFN